MEHIAVIVTSLSTLIMGILAGWFAYNQKTKDALTDQKIKQIEDERIRASRTENRHAAFIYGELFRILYELKADRVYIVQPHPEKKKLFLSIIFEVNNPGVSPMRDVFNNVPISDVPLYAKELSTTNCIWHDYKKGIVPDDKKALSLMRTSGSMNTIIYQLKSIENDWVGSLFIERTSGDAYEIEKVKGNAEMTVNSIQYILPPIN